jgi:hypothetical protein
MPQLRAPVALHDVADIEAFVHATLNDSGIEFATSERDELVAEGLAIMCDLSGRFEPHRAGYEQAGRFSGFAAFYLPKKLAVAWHRLHPEHRYGTDEDGKRCWQYFNTEVSIDGLRGERAAGEDSDVDAAFLARKFWVSVAQQAA